MYLGSTRAVHNFESTLPFRWSKVFYNLIPSLECSAQLPLPKDQELRLPPARSALTTISELAKIPKSKSLKYIVSSKPKQTACQSNNAELAKPLAYVAVLPQATWGRTPFPQILFQAPWQQYSPAKGIREGKPFIKYVPWRSRTHTTSARKSILQTSFQRKLRRLGHMEMSKRCGQF